MDANEDPDLHFPFSAAAGFFSNVWKIRLYFFQSLEKQAAMAPALLGKRQEWRKRVQGSGFRKERPEP